MSRGARGVVRIEVERRFEVSVREGFDYITDPANWPEYWPRFVRLDPDSRWREPGDRSRLTLRMLGREVELEMTLSRVETCRAVEYTSEQRGLPAARHWRHFDEAGGSLAYRIVIDTPPGRVGEACSTGPLCAWRPRAPRARRWPTSNAASASNADRQTTLSASAPESTSMNRRLLEQQ
jgi:hypothetical protein